MLHKKKEGAISKTEVFIMKKFFTAWLAACCMMSFSACQSADTRQASEGTSVTEEQAQVEAIAGQLQNKMSEQERNSVSVGKLTLLDDENNAEVSNSDNHIVEVELWNNQDYLKWTEENKDMFSEEEYQEKIDFYSSNAFTSIAGVVIDGRYYTGFMPTYDYDGGEITYYVDDSISVDGELTTTEPEEFHFSTFEEFSIWYRDYVDKEAEDGYTTQAEADQLYEDMLIIFNSVINDTYEILDEPAKNHTGESDFKSNWEFDSDEVTEIQDSVSEISIYDEELDTTFLVHVTLPPDFDASQTYPMFVMTDGVWRFGDHPALWNMMKNEEAEDVILVSIGYDFELDGTDNAVRAIYFCEKKDLFLNFITDNLMPYLSECYSIDVSQSGLYGHSLGGVFTHYAVCHSDLFENQPFQYYIIGSSAFWSPYFLPNEDNPPAYQSEYGYFDRNATFNKTLYVCGGEEEDADYAEYYGENDSTLEGISHFMQRLEEHSVTTAECRIYDGANHYEYIPDMFREFFLKFYGKS